MKYEINFSDWIEERELFQGIGASYDSFRVANLSIY